MQTNICADVHNLCNNGKSSKLPNARGTTVRYHGCVACLEDTYNGAFQCAGEHCDDEMRKRWSQSGNAIIFTTSNR